MKPPDFQKDYDVLQAVRGKKNQKFCALGKLHLTIFSLPNNENFISKNLRIKVVKEIDFWLAVFNFYTRPAPISTQYQRHIYAIATPYLRQIYI